MEPIHLSSAVAAKQIISQGSDAVRGRGRGVGEPRVTWTPSAGAPEGVGEPFLPTALRGTDPKKAALPTPPCPPWDRGASATCQCDTGRAALLCPRRLPLGFRLTSGVLGRLVLERRRESQAMARSLQRVWGLDEGGRRRALGEQALRPGRPRAVRTPFSYSFLAKRSVFLSPQI